MADRPNVTGKGPALVKEMVDIFKELQGTGAPDDVKSTLGGRGEELEKIGKMAYLKTVKAGEVSWDCKEVALEIKAAVEAGDNDKAAELTASLDKDLENLIHKIKTFVVRMT